jgi:2-oxoglutarate dehydrogenase E2 component (dihydrolipoamide succinyltransferase)
MLTTFNEVDMGAVMACAPRYKDHSRRRHGVKLGFMRLLREGLRRRARRSSRPSTPRSRATTSSTAPSSTWASRSAGPSGLVVPVLRDAEDLSFADIEKRIGDFGKRVRDGQLKLEEMAGGSFTITNGGTYGSLMSTPILNPPQSGILGMHKIQDRPMAVGGKVEIRPMMYLALSYDHRIVDGKEAVSFLVRVKEAIEDPRRLMLGV